MTNIAIEYRILFSTAGYYPNATKRALVRSVHSKAPNSLDCSACYAMLRDSEKIVWNGALKYRGYTYGVELWEIDFSEFKDCGKYSIDIQLSDINGETGRLESLEFEIADWIIADRILKPLSIYNSESRYASSTDKHGYYDCNTEMGESFSHGRFLYGLADYYKVYGSTLNTLDKSRLCRAMDTAFDYLYILWREDGEIAHSWPTRFQADANPGIHNSYWSVMGMMSHMALISDTKSKDYKEEFFNKMTVCVDYLEKNGYTVTSSDGGIIPIYYYMYKGTGNIEWLNKSFKALNSQCEGFNILTGLRFASPITTGLNLLLAEYPNHPDSKKWREFAHGLVNDYFVILRDRNIFRAMPCIGSVKTIDEWADMTDEPKGMGNLWGIRHTFTSLVANMVIDSINLSEITGDRSLEAVATGGIGWIFGINPGFPKWAVSCPEASQDYEAACTIANTPFRHAKAWTEWSFEMKNPYWQSVPNGFVFKERSLFEYPDQWQSAETFIATDGVLLSSLVSYEQFISKHSLPTHDSDSFETNTYGKLSITSGWWENCPKGIRLYNDKQSPGYVKIETNIRNGQIKCDVNTGNSNAVGLTCRGRIIVFSQKDELAGYHILLDAKEQEIALYTRVAQLRKIARVPFIVKQNTTYQIRVEFNEFNIRVFIDGLLQIDILDPLPMQPGHWQGCCGLYVDSGYAEFDKLYVSNTQEN